MEKKEQRIMRICSWVEQRWLLASFCGLALLLQTGCWSKDEIEDLSIYVGIALDIPNETPIEKKMDKLGSGYPKKDLVTYTLQIVDKQSESKSGDTKSDSNAKPYLNVSETGDSLFEMIREFSVRLERPVVGHHLKIIVINEQLSRRINMNNLLDFNLRDNAIRPNTLVFMTSGPSRSALEAKGNSIIPAFRIIGMVDNRYRTLKIIPPVSLIQLEAKMNSKASYMLQNIIAADGEVKFSGASIIKGETQKFVGRLTEEELLGVSWIIGKGKGGVVKSHDKETKKIIAYEIKSMKSNIHSHIKGDKISFDVQIKSEGRLIEEWINPEQPVGVDFKNRVEEAVEDEVKHMIKLGLAKIQKDYKTDVIGFGKRFSIEHPRQWQRLKKDWDETFSQAEVNYDVTLKITEMGAKQGH
jgi:spore germination protein